MIRRSVNVTTEAITDELNDRLKLWAGICIDNVVRLVNCMGSAVAALRIRHKEVT